MKLKYIVSSILSMLSVSIYGQIDSIPFDTSMFKGLDGITITAKRTGVTRMAGAENGVTINRDELFKAACCNLGESFSTNPSVDVNYSDAATGAKQIKLLGLSGTYVQMLTENMPNLRGTAAPFSLDYVPGPWMNSIQVSKGASSVRNGYEGITGQIDVEYLKPQDDQGLTLNLYGNSLSRFEANADANLHLNEHVSTEVLAHYQDDYGHHDQNDDGFLDQPNVRQYNIQNRWRVQSGKYIFHGGVALLKENREGGQIHASSSMPHYKIDLSTNRYEAYMKHALVLDPTHGTNLALMANASLHQLDALYGAKEYQVDENNAYAQLLFETSPTERHNIAAGLSINHDRFDQQTTLLSELSGETETTPGAYVQYTYTPDYRLTAMAGLRIDHSSIYGTFVTPRLHLKAVPSDMVTLRLSAGKGYRSTHAWAENNNLLASGRQLIIEELKQESAWNYGISSAFFIPLFEKTLKINAEYYYTHFINQTVLDYDSSPSIIRIANLDGRSYSNTFQIDASYPIIEGLDVTAAYRLNDVKTTYGGNLMEKPLSSRHKGLLTLSYKTPLELWQFDITLQVNGGGRMPSPYLLDDGTPSWNERFPTYVQLSAQVTRWFRHFSIYIGGENLTNYRQQQTIIDADNPWGTTFDPTMVWGPVHGILAYAGLRVNVGRL
ncbi:MAG: TonB-dependent receptor [Bacteroidales bacterium]|nr:TonB-dependent receptor [Bacteroidales bacterium]